MKVLSILLIFSISLPLFAQTKSATLVIRGRVPASTVVEFDHNDPTQEPRVRFRGSKAKPQVEVSSEKDHRKITIIHP